MMTAKSYNGPEDRGYGAPLGIRLIAELDTSGLDLFPVAQAIEAGHALGLSRGHTNMLLHQLAAAGWVTRLKRGLYAVNDTVTRLPRSHPFAIGTALVSPSAVSHWSALQHWGLTEQIPSAVTLSSPRRTFPPQNQAAASRQAAWVVAGTAYEFVAIAAARFFGVTHEWISERDRVPVFDRERALLDAFHHFHVFGSLSVALQALEAHLGDIEVRRLVAYAGQLGVAAVVGRVGWALEQFDVEEEALEPLRRHVGKGDAPLDPARPARGRHHPTWRVIENL
jgi:predicted transcriptional regulator of viral defense system